MKTITIEHRNRWYDIEVKDNIKASEILELGISTINVEEHVSLLAHNRNGSTVVVADKDIPWQDTFSLMPTGDNA